MLSEKRTGAKSVTKLFTKKGNVCGFDAIGRGITGWFGKDKLWHVAQTGHSMTEYLTNGTHKLFDTLPQASGYATSLIDQAQTDKLKWW